MTAWPSALLRAAGLRPQDFGDEQAYHIAMRRRHIIAHHLWGIVRGLELAVENALFVQPGIAVDGYGRELILSARRPRLELCRQEAVMSWSLAEV